MDFNKGKVSVLVIGAMPPPIGGVTIHIKRLFEKAVNDERVLLEVLDLKKRRLYTPSFNKKSIWALVMAFSKADVVHVQISSPAKAIIALLSFLFRKRVFYTHHNSRPENRLIARVLGGVCEKIILVNESVAQYFDSPGKIAVVPAFIPPVSQEVLRKDVVRDLERFDVVLAINAYGRNYINGREVYGIDILYSAIADLNERVRRGEILPYAKRVGVFFFDPSDAYAEMDGRVGTASGGLEILRYSGGDLSFYELLKASHVCLRPTRTDGDPLSIREAIFLGVDVLASDAAIRPAEVSLFSSGDCKDFADKIDLVTRGNGGKASDRGEKRAAGLSFYEDIVCLYIGG